jgi:hypothetical protein
MPDPGSGAGFVKWNRKALDDESQQVVRTIVRRGYVFNVPVMSGAEFRRRTPHETDDDLTSPRPMIRGANTAAQDARTILRTAVEHHPSPPQHTTSELADDKGLTHRPRRWAWMAALSALLVAASAVVAEFRRASPTRGTASTASDYTKVTNFTDSAFSPALSPDGRMVTFVRGEAMTVGGEGDIFIKLLPDGEPVQLTHDGGMKMSPGLLAGRSRCDGSPLVRFAGWQPLAGRRDGRRLAALLARTAISTERSGHAVLSRLPLGIAAGPADFKPYVGARRSSTEVRDRRAVNGGDLRMTSSAPWRSRSGARR